uniref:Uncharacterized protein n=1 Tax=Rhodococcus sp. NS1 TaxID=402236 RepID=A0A097SQK0_9NOCA|nr:hypothetical protein LRS1606.358 [Rhodococcus sp. NS1]
MLTSPTRWRVPRREDPFAEAGGIRPQLRVPGPSPLRSTPTHSKLPSVPIACSSPSRFLWDQAAARQTSTLLSATYPRVSLSATPDSRTHPTRRHPEGPRGPCQLSRALQTTRGAMVCARAQASRRTLSYPV